MENGVTDEKNKDSLETFSAATLQSPWQKTHAERVVIQHVVQANLSHDPDLIIKHVCAAAIIYSKANKKNKPETLNVDLMKQLRKVNQALSKPQIIRWREFSNYSYSDKKAWRILWGFNEDKENFDLLIKPWLVSMNLRFYADQIVLNKEWRVKVECPNCGNTMLDILDSEHLSTVRLSKEKYGKIKKRVKRRLATLREIDEMLEAWEREYHKNHVALPLPGRYVEEVTEYLVFKCPNCGREAPANGWTAKRKEAVKVDPFWKFFFEATKILTEAGYIELCNSFVDYAEPISHETSAILCSLVDPNTLDEVFRLFRKKPTEIEETEIEGDLEERRRNTKF